MKRLFAQGDFMENKIPNLSEFGVTQEMLDELERSIEIAYSNVRDPEVMRQAAERMDRLAQEIYEREGLLDLAVPLVRESRDEE
jgi:hypothetical protein